MSLASRHYNILRYGIRNRLVRPNARYASYPYQEENCLKVKDFLSKFDTGCAVVFVGMRQAKYSLGLDNPFRQTTELLADIYESLIVPSFSHSVRISGVYDVKSTRSDVGNYSQLFLDVADYRTLSPYKSYALKGVIADSFRGLQYENDYAPGGAFEFIQNNAITAINIGTMALKFSCIHYAEYLSRVPYVRNVSRCVTIIDSHGMRSEVTVTEQNYKGIAYKFNLHKVERDLLKNELLHQIKINDLVVRVLPEQKYFDYIMGRLKKNPYYLVD
ncbi:MAG: AAC(3) family N-acetyltransferase [Clostridia bacterium]|nr:AAC(3) family N-acetyltransferase [Clostridia bacterium]